MVTVDRIGLSVREGQLHAVGLSHGAVVWTASTELESMAAVEASLLELLREVPRSRWRRPTLIAAVGTGHAQLRRLGGLPDLKDRRLVTSLVGENLNGFFLRSEASLLPGLAVPGTDGTWWAAAFEEPLISALRRAANVARVRLSFVLPTLAILPQAFEGSEFTWCDSGIATVVRFEGSRLAESRRIAPDTQAHQSCSVERRWALGAVDTEFAPACAAASLTNLHDYPVLALADRIPDSPAPRWRAAAALAGLVVAAGLALAAPGIGASMRLAQVRRDSSALEPLASQAAAAELDLARFRTALKQFASIGAGARRPITRLLAGLTRTLPDSAVLAGVRVDSTGVQVVVLAERAGAALARLERWELIAAPTIVGPITRELVGGRERERATIRFRLR